MRRSAGWVIGGVVGIVAARVLDAAPDIMSLPRSLTDRLLVSAGHDPGDVIGELSGRAGSIGSMELLNSSTQRITAEVPLARMFGFTTELRSRTQGRGTSAMEFDHYAKVPEATALELVKKRSKS